MTTIYLVRHGEAEGNIYRRIQGQYDSRVTPRGLLQLQALSNRFSAVPLDAVYAGDLTRAKETAAAIAEEFGLAGALMVMLAYALFFYEGIRIALTRRSPAHMLLSAGAASIFFLQAFVIIAGVTKFLPLTGITLPFVSYGGSSMVSSFLLLGILIAASRKEPGGKGAR